MTEILADTHVHLYPCYDLSKSFEYAWENFQALAAAPNAHCILYLTERSDCFYFRDLAAGRISLRGFEIVAHSDPEVLLVKRKAGGQLAVVAGRQIAAAQRSEVLALYTREEFEDGLSVEASIDAARASGAVVVLNWSIGKWMFGRGERISAIIDESSPDAVLLGDIAGRPNGWSTPRLMRKGASQGFRTVAGSDPLPFAGEERQIAKYVTRIGGVAEGETKSDGFYRNILKEPRYRFEAAGRRNSPVLAVNRLWNNRVHGLRN